jgi:hypothetical protein
MKSSLWKERGIPFIFFLTTIAAYGLLLNQTGFYWDDWVFVFLARFLGPADFFPAFADVRPFLSPIFYVTTSLLPPEPIYWQTFMLVIRFGSGWLAWFIFRQVWPQQKQAALAASFLFLLFPGYSQHWVAYTHINQEWIAFLFYLFSFGLTARALRNPDQRTVNTIFALLFLVLGVFPTEYFVTQEPLRFLFIWVIVSERTMGFRQRLLESLKLWVPYVLVWLINGAWLAYFYTIGSYTSYEVEVVREPLSLLTILRTTADAIWKAGLYCWAQILLLIPETLPTPSSLLTLLLIAGSFGFLVFYFMKVSFIDGSEKGFAIPAMLMGVAGIVLGRIPSFAADLPLTLQSSNDRFMVSMMIGGSLFITGLVCLVAKNDRLKSILFAGLISLAVGQQFFNANIFRRDWLKQQDFYWQLAWRIPAMQPGTLLLTDEIPVDYEVDRSLTAPLNWIYAPDFTRSNLPYALVYTTNRLGGSLPSLEPGVEVEAYLRTVHFTGSTSQAIVLYVPREGCLRVLGSQWKDEITYGGLSDELVRAIPLSKPDLIIVDSENTPSLPFLSEPEHDWCYYYTKAELARQKQDWPEINRLLTEAASRGYEAADPFEWLVFIEAQATTGGFDSAIELSRRTLASEQRTRRGVCQVWQRVQTNTSFGAETVEQLRKYLTEFKC